MALENDSWGYWLNTVHTKPKARELAARLQLHMLSKARCMASKWVSCIPCVGSSYLERTWQPYLVRRGQMRPMVKKIHRDARIEVLLCPPPTSPSHTIATFIDQDYTGPWRPRGPSQEEQDTLAKVREIGRIMNS
jgi:hypothetical protein